MCCIGLYTAYIQGVPTVLGQTSEVSSSNKNPTINICPEMSGFLVSMKTNTLPL
jgi:hypothetical protein